MTFPIWYVTWSGLSFLGGCGSAYCFRRPLEDCYWAIRRWLRHDGVPELSVPIDPGHPFVTQHHDEGVRLIKTCRTTNGHVRYSEFSLPGRPLRRGSFLRAIGDGQDEWPVEDRYGISSNRVPDRGIHLFEPNRALSLYHEGWIRRAVAEDPSSIVSKDRFIIRDTRDIRNTPRESLSTRCLPLTTLSNSSQVPWRVMYLIDNATLTEADACADQLDDVTYLRNRILELTSPEGTTPESIV